MRWHDTWTREAGTLALRILRLLVLASLFVPVLVDAQRAGPILLVHGRPNPLIDPPNVQVCVSVVDRQTARAIPGLTEASFRLSEAHTAVPPVAVTPEEVGMAIVFVIDRGGISQPGDLRIREATGLVREFVERLAIAGAPNDDVLAIIGIGQGGVLLPLEDFSYNPVDKNLVLNALIVMEGEAVRGGTPLYEGLDKAIDLLVKNPDSALREVLASRRKTIVVFSDGLDPDFSDEAREQDIIRKAVAHGIPLYTIGMARGSLQLTGEANLKKLAAQTEGLYRLHNQSTHAEVLSLFDDVVTQREQYILTYQTRQPKGAYPLDITVETPVGSTEESVEFVSVLEIPKISLNPLVPPGIEFTIPYSDTLEAVSPLTLAVSVSVAPVDGIQRAPEWVRYFANGDQIAESTDAPDFVIAWPVGERHTPGPTAITEDFTLLAEAFDPYLQRPYTTEVPLRIKVIWEAQPAQTESETENTQPQPNGSFSWLILLMLGLILGLLLLLLVLVRTRRDVARKVVTGGTGALKGVTRPLGAGGVRSPGKIVIQKGANVGREYSLSAPVTKVGRDPQFSDFALYDEYVSNPHFTVHLEGMQFYITDEASTNGTRLNGLVLQPYQRIPLPPDAVIELGETRLQFKVVAPTVNRPSDVAPPAAVKSAQREWSTPVEWYDENPYRTQPVPKYTLPRRPSQPNPYVTKRVDSDQQESDEEAPEEADLGPTARLGEP